MDPNYPYSRDLIDQATLARTVNLTYLTVTVPTNAEVAQQVRRLTRQNNGIIRILLGLADGTD